MTLKTIALSATLVFAAACAYHAPTSPSPSTTTAPGPPARITMNVVPGIGASVTQAAISATVSDANGRGVPNVTVTFSATVGTFSQASLVTGSDGLVQTMLTAVKPSTITASAGAATASTFVAIAADLLVSVSSTTAVTGTLTNFNASAQQPNGAVQFKFDFGDGYFAGPGGATASHIYAHSGSYPLTVTAVDTAGRSGATAVSLTVADPPVTPTPAPTPTPTPAPAVLSIAVECTAATHLNPTGCHVTMTGADGSALTSSITSIDWDWGDGHLTTTTNPPSGASTTHAYDVAGTFVVIATAHAPTAPPAGVTNQTTVKIP